MGGRINLMEKRGYIITNWSALSQIAPAEPFFCWVHIASNAPEHFDEGIMQLARLGAVAFFITGQNSADMHDAVDDVLESIQKPDTPTIWNDEITEDVSWEFLHLRFGESVPDLRLVVVAAPQEEEISIMSSIVKNLERAATH
jgi:hypothetical protein